jgi:hypothetical protein
MKFDNFSTKYGTQFHLKKISLKKLISLCNMQPNTLARRKYKGKIYVKNFRRNSCRIRIGIRIRNHLKSRIRTRKKYCSGSTSLMERKKNLYRSTSERILYRCFLLLLSDIYFTVFFVYFARRWQA